MSEHSFCRGLLKEVMVDVARHTTPQQLKEAWAWKTPGIRGVEFHGPDGFYWHGSADCLWEAKSKGWEAWMVEKGFADEGTS